MYTTDILIPEQLMDTMLLSRIIDKVMKMDGKFNLDETKMDSSDGDRDYTKIKIGAPTCEQLDEILKELKEFGASSTDDQPATLSPVTKDGVSPEGFYSSTNIDTYINVDGKWIPVEDIEMDCTIVVDTVNIKARCCPIASLLKGEHVVTGNRGIRVATMGGVAGDEQGFSFMGSDVSSERQKSLMIKKIAEEIKDVRKGEGNILIVAGPAVVHTGAGKHLEALINAGYVDAFLTGNAVAVHDVEAALLGTSLGINIKDGTPAPMGHTHHLIAINEIRKYGSLHRAVEVGILKKGIMHALITNNVPFVLAGSIRDDGPLPDTITDSVEAQEAMRKSIKGTKIVLMLSTMLHSIATGNLLPARVKTVCVDINPATVTKLTDRGSHQAVGIVSDVEWFLKELSSHFTV